MSQFFDTLNDILFFLVLVLLVAAAAGAFSGCAGPATFSKVGSQAGEFERDKYDCVQQWEQSAGAIAFHQDPVGNAYYGFQFKDKLYACLERKGWVRVNG